MCKKKKSTSAQSSISLSALGQRLTWPSLCRSDFPGEVSTRIPVDQASPLLWKNRTKRRRASNPGEMYNEQGASEADIDSDSGYCSPKHNQGAGVTQRTAENAAAAPVRLQPVKLSD